MNTKAQVLGATVAVLAAAGAAQAQQSVRFVVAEMGGPRINDAYTLVLTEPTAIAHARDLVSQGPGAGMALVVARIAEGADGVNRNWRAPGAPAWNWRLTEFVGFADMTPEILDGWPEYVEENPAAWIANTEGMIGFWTYTVVQELPPACYANCDDSTTAPVLNILDFTCFMTRYAAGDPAANCDGSTVEPVLNVADFGCFLTRFAGGCP